MGETTGWRRRPHPKIQYIHQMIQDYESEYYSEIGDDNRGNDLAQIIELVVPSEMP